MHSLGNGAGHSQLLNQVQKLYKEGQWIMGQVTEEAWLKVQGIMEDLLTSVEHLRHAWPEDPSDMPSEGDLGDIQEALLDVVGGSAGLQAELFFMGGTLAGQRQAFIDVEKMSALELKHRVSVAKAHIEEDESGYVSAEVKNYTPEDKIIDITTGCAPCSEIGESLGYLAPQAVYWIARNAGIKPSGRVTWKLVSGETVEARAFNRDEWRRIRDEAIRRGKVDRRANYLPPKRIAP